MSVFSSFPLNLGIGQTSFDMVAKLVSETSEDAEITLPVNMIQAEHVSVPGRAQRVLDAEEAHATLLSFVENSGASGKFFDSLKLPEFSGDKQDFETWQPRFT